ncbi:hypothetical protein ACFSTC_32880 [Nonomuraea ferruginea]
MFAATATAAARASPARHRLGPALHLHQPARVLVVPEPAHRRQVDRHHGVLVQPVQPVQRLAGQRQQHRPAPLVDPAPGAGRDAVDGQLDHRGGRGESADPLRDGQHGASLACRLALPK